MVFSLGGCTDGDKFRFSGSGDHWEVIYDFVITNNVESQTAGKIKYIGDDKAPERIDFEIVYNELGQGSSSDEGGTLLKNGSYKFKNVTCGNCEIIQKDDEIVAKIMWEGQTETIILTMEE